MMIGSRLGRALKASLLAATLIVSVPASLAAQPKSKPPAGKTAQPKSKPPAGNAAKEQFDSAQDLYDHSKYDAALVLFRQAWADSKSPNARLMIARCLLALGRLTEAYDEFTATLREAATKAESEPKYVAARDAAAGEIASLEAKIAKIVLTFADPRATAQVTVNGALVPREKLGAPMAVLPGKIEISAVGLGADTVKRVETLAAGETRTLVLGPQPAPANTASASPSATPSASPSVTPSASPTAEPTQTGGGVRKAGFAVLGLGVAGAALFGVGAAMGQSKLDQLQKECGGARCTDPKYSAVVDDGKTFDLLANIGLGVGIAGIVGGTAMIIFGGPKDAPPASAAFVSVSPRGAALHYSGSF